MTAPYRKKLIEVALPLAKINEAAAREKSIRHGHPSTLHLWWARRPLAACRAVLFASLVDDPDSDPEFRLLGEEFAGKKRADLFSLIEELVQWENSNNPEVIRSARAEIARCVASRLVETGDLERGKVIADGVTVGDLITLGHCRCVPAEPDRNGRARYRFETARLPAAAAVDRFLAEHAPPVLDPFCGGGSIPLEAQRLGLRAYASDLNPVAVLITKALIEIPPRFAGRPPVNPAWQKKSAAEKALKTWTGAQGLAEDVRYYGQWMRDEAEKRIGHLYPKVKITKEMAKDRPDLKEYVGEKLTVIAWLWARTVPSPNPAVRGAHVPLVRSFWLSTKKGKEAWIEPVIHRNTNCFEFVVRKGEPKKGQNPGQGTVGRKGGRCLLTGDAMPFPHIRGEGQAGHMQARLMGIVAEGKGERIYLSPQEEQADLAHSAMAAWKPDAELPNNPRDFKTPNYGMRTFSDLFTARQLAALTTFTDLVHAVHNQVLKDARNIEESARFRSGSGPSAPQGSDNAQPLAEHGRGALAYADAVATYLGMCASKSSVF